MRNILRKVFYFKMKEINLKKNKMYETKYQTKQKKTKSPSRIFYKRKNWSGENGGQSSLFSDGLRKVNFTGDYLSNKLFKLKSIKLMTNIQETYQLRVIIMN